MKRRLSNRTAQFLVVFLASAGAALAADDDVMPSSTTVAYGDWTQNCMLIQMQKEGEPQPGAPQRPAASVRPPHSGMSCGATDPRWVTFCPHCEVFVCVVFPARFYGRFDIRF